MNIKRKSLAFILSVFILCGCENTSETTVMNDIEEPINIALNKEINLTSKSQRKLEYNNPSKVKEVEYKAYDGSGEIEWIASLRQEATQEKTIYTIDQVQDKMGTVLEESIHSIEKIEAKPAIMQYGGSVSTGSTFKPRLTAYGADCIGCGSGTAGGVKLNTTQVLQSDGTWLDGITYDGYYIVAADKKIPMYSILKISNHGYSGKGLQPQVPIYAMVLDRGGGVNGSHLDFFVGSEVESTSLRVIHTQAEVEIIRVGA